MKYDRTILKEVVNSIEEYPVTLVTGARQVGKSTLVSYFEVKGYKYITFDVHGKKLFIKKYQKVASEPNSEAALSFYMASLSRFELLAARLGGGSSIHLRYRDNNIILSNKVVNYKQ